MTFITGPDPTGADRPAPAPDSPTSAPAPPPPPPAPPQDSTRAEEAISGPAALWFRFRSLKGWQQGLIVFGLLAALGAILPDQAPEEADMTMSTTVPTTVAATTSTDGPEPDNGPSAATAGPVTDEEVVAAFQSFVDERVAAGVRFAGTVRNITISNRVVRVVFDPAKAGFDLATFRSINPFDNLAEFAGTPIMFKDDVGKRLRPAIDAVESVLPDGTSLGSLTTAKLYKIGTGEDL